MGNNHNETIYNDGTGDKCGLSWPNTDAGTDSSAHEGVGGSTGNTCDGKGARDITWPPRNDLTEHGNVNICSIHRDVRGKGVFDNKYKNDIKTGKYLKKETIVALNKAIKDEINKPGNPSAFKAGWNQSYNGTIQEYPHPDDFNDMKNAIGDAYDDPALNQGTERTSVGKIVMPSFNNTGIDAVDVGTLIKAYEKMVGDCICNADCGANTQCACHNNCGCHY